MPLLPNTCLLCHTTRYRHSNNICATCKKNLPWLLNSCYQCGISLPVESPTVRIVTSSRRYCAQCLLTPLQTQTTIAAFHYTPPIPSLLIGLKFHGNLLNSRLLGHLLKDKLLNYYTNHQRPQLIIPIPLHKNRIKQRGFNQALELVRPVANALQLPIKHQACQRIIDTSPQSLITHHQQRKHNVTAAFQANNIVAKHVAIIDDIITSGATINACINALTANGVKKIDIWCCARA